MYDNYTQRTEVELKEMMDKAMAYYNVHTIQDFANAIGIGSPATISKWKERGQTAPLEKRLVILGTYEKIFGKKSTMKIFSKMTQREIHTIFGISPATFASWSNPVNPKHNTYLILADMNSEEAREKLRQIKEGRGL